jgi:hypothetical protein
MPEPVPEDRILESDIVEFRAVPDGADADVALFEAVRNGMDVTEASILLTNGANANYDDTNYGTVLCLASAVSPAHPASARALQMIEVLVRHGAAVNLQSKSGETALARASYAGNVDAVKLLIQLGADVNQQGDCERTALHWVVIGLRDHLLSCPAGRSGTKAYAMFVYAAQALLDRGADRSIVDNRGCTAAQTAAPAQQACLASPTGRKTLATMVELLAPAQGSGRVGFFGRWTKTRTMVTVAVLAAMAWWCFMWWMLLMVAWRPPIVRSAGPAIRQSR